MWQNFQPKFIILFFTQVQHFFHISHTRGMIKLKGMKNDNVNERITDWAKVIRNQNGFPSLMGFLYVVIFYIFPTLLHMISLLKQPYLVKVNYFSGFIS